MSGLNVGVIVLDDMANGVYRNSVILVIINFYKPDI